MNLADTLRTAAKALVPTWLVGPVLDKELRVASRRRRSYVIRLTYLLAMMVFIFLVWQHTVAPTLNVYEAEHTGYSDYNLRAISIMAEIGKRIVADILWFQFIAAQVLAMFLLCNSITEEVTKRTLGILFTTPILSFQIVVGKLLGRLLQVLILLAISLPLLAMVQVMGGVEIRSIIAGLCVTVTAAMMVGALTMAISTFSRSTTSTLIMTIAGYGLGLLLVAASGAFPYVLSKSGLYGSPLSLLHPLFTMVSVTQAMLDPAMASSYSSTYWIADCVLMLFVTVVLLLSTMGNMHRLAQTAMFGPAPSAGGKKHASARPQTVKGPALLWKDLRFYLPGSWKVTVLVSGAAMAILMVSYSSFATCHMLDDRVTHLFYIGLYFGVGVFLTALMSATAITVEKESQSLLILLTAPVGDTEIILTKASGVFRRALPMWILLAAHLLVFSIIGYISPVGAILFAMLAACTAVFLTGLGLCLSSLVRNSSSAVTAIVCVCGALWFGLPVLAGLASPRWEDAWDFVNPFRHIPVVFMPPGHPLLPMMLMCLVYAGLGLLLAWQSKIMIRRNLFRH